MECLSPDQVLHYLASDATAVGLGEIEAHVEGCEPCRTTIAATIRAGRATAAAPTDPGAGQTIGRYIVQSLHGTGAMGHVLEAHDPELDRRVAIKIVRHHGHGGDARALREGRALARIAHPNVVTVHDVGTWDGGVFLAMELVDGTTVRGWLATPRTSREVIRLFADVSRGLAAAHGAGLVHRDIKPENLVVGSDGRVRILDFGLAIDEPNEGERSGTPAYMAPEQETGEATIASDQYAFAITLFEALEGARPVRPIKFERAPRWVRPAIVRALSIDPARRYPRMLDLARVFELGLDRRRRIAVATGISLALATGLGAMAVVTHADQAACDGGVPDENLALVHTAIASHAGAPLADQAVAKVEAWHSRASVLRTSTCKAAHADERGASERLRCIDAVTREVHVVVGALAQPSAALASNALETIDRASDLSACTSAVVPAVSDPFLAAGFEIQLAQLAVTDASGDWGAAERGAIALAKQLDHDTTRSLEARAWMEVGRARMTARRVMPAREAFERALLAAEVAGDDALRAKIYLSLVGANLDTLRRGEARRWLALARALLVKIGDPAIEWRVGVMAGVVDEDPVHGAATLQAAVDAYAKVAPSGDETTVVLLSNLGSVLDAANRRDDAIATLQRAIATGERVLGPNHPQLVRPLQDLAYSLAGAGKPDASIAMARRALAIAERSNGDVGVSTVRLALELMREGQLNPALELVDRSLPLVIAYDGPHSALAGNVYLLRGILRGQANRNAEAVDDFLHALEIERTYRAPDAADFIDLFEYLGRAQRSLGHTDDALRSFSEAQQIRARQADHKPVDDVGIETAMGGTLVDAGRIAEGLPHLDRALELARTGTDAEAVAFAEFELAKALIAGKHDRARTKHLLEDARAIYLAQDAAERERLAGWNDEVVTTFRTL